MVIRQTGPAAASPFWITGVLVVLVVQMVGEMVCAPPAVGYREAGYSRHCLRRKTGLGQEASH